VTVKQIVRVYNERELAPPRWEVNMMSKNVLCFVIVGAIYALLQWMILISMFWLPYPLHDTLLVPILLFLAIVPTMALTVVFIRILKKVTIRISILLCFLSLLISSGTSILIYWIWLNMSGPRGFVWRIFTNTHFFFTQGTFIVAIILSIVYLIIKKLRINRI